MTAKRLVSQCLTLAMIAGNRLYSTAVNISACFILKTPSDSALSAYRPTASDPPSIPDVQW